MQTGDRPNKALRRLVQACVLGVGLWPVQASLADDAAETCFPIYGKGKAIPRTRDCEAKAATAPTDLSNYFCVASPQLIQRFCDAQCEVDPLTPITDPGLIHPFPRLVSEGGDPIHFQHKSRKQNMKPLLAAPAVVMAVSTQAAMYSPEQLGLSIAADGVHVRQDDGSVIAVYTYTITNKKAPQIRAITVGADTDDALAPPLLNDKGFLINRDWLSAPAQWTGTVSVLEESTRKVIEWEPAEPDNWDIGVFPGQTITLTVRAHAAMPDLLTTSMMVHMKTFKYLKTPAVQLTPSDTTAPTLSTQLDVAPAPDRPGWLKVSAGHAVLDNHDPYPQTVLSRIDSNQPITGKDIDAAIGTPAPVFYLKQAKGRTYAVSYQAMDASGNATTSRSLVNASR